MAMVAAASGGSAGNGNDHTPEVPVRPNVKDDDDDDVEEEEDPAPA